MKKLALILGMILTLTACNSEKIPESNNDSQSNSGNSSTEQSTQSTESTVESVPEGEPTNLIGLDGKPIYTSEINTNITDTEIIERLSDYTYYEEPIKPDAVLDSYMYLKPSAGKVYDMYNNPEMYGEDEEIPGYKTYIGEKLENPNEWRRVNVGDEFCGLTLKSVGTGFTKDENGNYTSIGRSYCDFDGTVTLTGFLHIMPSAELYNMPGGELVLCFPSSELPIMAGSPIKGVAFEDSEFQDSIVFDFNGFHGYCEIQEINLDETIDDTDVDLSGLSRGDFVKVNATISGLSCDVQNYKTQTFRTYKAHLENIEILSDVIPEP